MFHPSQKTLDLLEDIEKRIDPETEEDFQDQWKDFLYDRFKGELFRPKRKKLSLRELFLKLFTEDVVEVVVIAVLPFGGIKALYVIGLHNEYNENRNAEYYRCDERPLEPFSVAVDRLVLAVEGLSTARDAARKSVLAALLENDRNYDKRSGNEKQYKKNVL